MYKTQKRDLNSGRPSILLQTIFIWHVHSSIVNMRAYDAIWMMFASRTWCYTDTGRIFETNYSHQLDELNIVNDERVSLFICNAYM